MNKRGSMKLAIVIAVAAVVVAAGVVALLIWPRDPRPSGKFTVDRIVIKESLWQDGLAGKDRPTGQGDGAADIAAAIKAYDGRQAEIENERTRSTADAGMADLYDQVTRLYANPSKLTIGMTLPWRSSQFVLASSAKDKFVLEQHVPLPPLEWRWPMKFCRKLEAIALAAIVEGRMAEKRNHPEEAQKIYQAVLVYGDRLAGSQVRVFFQLEGLDAQASAAEALARLYHSQKKADKAKLAEEYMQAAQAAARKCRDVFEPVCRHQNKWNVGDLLLFASEHEDPAWRVEALLALGMCQYNPVAKGAEDAIARTLKKFAGDGDPYVSAAAKWGRDLSKPDYRTQTGTERQ